MPWSAIASTYGQRGVRERARRGHRHRAGHVRDAVVDDAVDLVGRLGVRRRAGRLEAAALVDRDVDEHRAGLHQPEHVARHELGRARAGHEHRADHEVGLADGLLDLRACSTSRGRAAVEHRIELAHAVDRAVEHPDVGLHADRDAAPRCSRRCRRRARRPCAGGTPGHAAQQHAAPAVAPSRARARPSAARAGRRPRSSARAAAGGGRRSRPSRRRRRSRRSRSAPASARAAGARCRYVKSIRPGRSCGYSGGSGSLTLSTSSLPAQTSSTCASAAPAAT